MKIDLQQKFQNPKTKENLKLGNAEDAPDVTLGDIIHMAAQNKTESKEATPEERLIANKLSLIGLQGGLYDFTLKQLETTTWLILNLQTTTGWAMAMAVEMIEGEDK